MRLIAQVLTCAGLFLAGFALGDLAEQAAMLPHIRSAHNRAEQAEGRLRQCQENKDWPTISADTVRHLQSGNACLLEVNDGIAQTVKSKRAATSGENGSVIIPLGTHPILFYAATEYRTTAMGFARTKDGQLIPFLWNSAAGKLLPAKPTKLFVERGRVVSLQEL